MTTRYCIQGFLCLIICAGCADGNSAQPDGPEDGGSGSVTGTTPVSGSGSSGTNESTGGLSSNGGTTVSLGGSGTVSNGGTISLPNGGASVSLGGSGATSNSGASSVSKGGVATGITPPSFGGRTASGGRSATGGSSGVAGTDLTCLAIGQSCSATGARQCCKSTQYEVICSGTCQYALVATTGGSSSQ